MTDSYNQTQSARPLAELLVRGPVDPSLVLVLIRGLAKALDDLHAQEKVHGNLNPQTVLVTPDDGIVLVGAGGARSPAYAAPEQSAGVTEARTDLYSMGVLVFELLTGANPFLRDDPADSISAHRDLAYHRLPAMPAGVPVTLKLGLRQLLEKEPERRYANAAAFVKSLEEPNLPSAAGTAPPPPPVERPELAAPPVVAAPRRGPSAGPAVMTAIAAGLTIVGLALGGHFLWHRGDLQDDLAASASPVATLVLPADPIAAVQASLEKFDPQGKARALGHESEVTLKGPDAQRNADILRRRWSARLEADTRACKVTEALAGAAAVAAKLTRPAYRLQRELEALGGDAESLKLAWRAPKPAYAPAFRPVKLKDLASRRTFGLSLGSLRLENALAASSFLGRKVGTFEGVHLDEMGSLNAPAAARDPKDPTLRLEWRNPEPVAFPASATGEATVVEVAMASPLARMTWLELRLSKDGKTWGEPVLFTDSAGAAQLGHLIEPADIDGVKFMKVTLARVTQLSAPQDAPRVQALFVHAIDAADAPKLASP